jgi:hypothetical protein
VGRELELALLLTGRGTQFEIGRRIPCFQRHVEPPCGIVISAHTAFTNAATLDTR